MSSKSSVQSVWRGHSGVEESLGSKDGVLPGDCVSEWGQTLSRARRTSWMTHTDLPSKTIELCCVQPRTQLELPLVGH